MKIGILTQPLQNNYGGLLQNYALQQVLKEMGHIVETIDWTHMRASALKECLFSTKLSILSLVNKNIDKPRYQLTKSEAVMIGRNTGRFVEKYINVCPLKVQHPEEFALIENKYKFDAYVVGSDQVWRPNYNSNMMPAMFLSFVKRENVKRIAYAASFGTSAWEFTPEMTEVCSHLAKQFNLITVREKSGVKLCKDNLDVDASQVLDPTMLLSKEVYECIIREEKEKTSEGDLFHYILDPTAEKKSFIKTLANNQGLTSFTIMPKCQAENRTRKDVKNHIEDCVFPSVSSWLRGFMDAKMVVVDSFHGAVFSIIFNKPFWVLANAKRGNARFESLMEIFGLEDRMVNPGDDLDSKKEIDWERVNEIRHKETARSKILLKEALK